MGALKQARPRIRRCLPGRIRGVVGALAAGAALAVVPASPGTAATSPPPPLIDIGTLGGSYSNATAVGRFGSVPVAAGYSATNSGVQHAFVWQKNVGMVDLHRWSPVAASTRSMATGVDAAGRVVVGWVETGASCSDTCRRAVSWTVSWGSTLSTTTVTYTDLGSDRGDYALNAYAISPDAGSIVGDGNNGSQTLACEWSGTGGSTTFLPSDNMSLASHARGVNDSVNDSQVVVGERVSQPVRWVAQNPAEPLDTLNQSSGVANAVSNLDVTIGYAIAGYVYDAPREGPSTASTAVVWTTADNGVTTANPLSAPGATSPHAYGISPNAKYVVGDASSRAVLWEPANGWTSSSPMTDLTNRYITSQWTILDRANAVDSYKDIVGYGQSRKGHDIHAFLLTAT